jgi:hypothetical protein
MARLTFGIGNINAAAPGLSKLASALAGGDQAYQQGYDQTIGAQTKIAQTLAQIQNAQAEAGLHTAQTRETGLKADALARRPDLYAEQVAAASGSDVPTVNAYREQLRTGKAPLVPMGPPTEDGQEGVGSLVLPDEKRSKITGAIQQFLPLLANGGDLNPEQLAKASQLFRESNLSDSIISGTANRNVVAGAQAAAGGKSIYSQNADGGVLDQYGGNLSTDNPLARSTISLRGAQAADASARAGLAGVQRDMASKGVIQQSGEDLMLVDPRTGKAKPITGPDDLPIAGKSSQLKPIPPQVNAKIIEGKQGLSNIDEAIAALEADPGAVGFTNGIPGAQTVKQLWATPQDIATRAKVANIGSLVLHDRSGAAVSASEFPRLAPFIPSPSDSKKTAVEKLRQMKQIAEGELGLFAGTYNEDNGYRPSPILANKPPAAPQAGGWKYLGKE